MNQKITVYLIRRRIWLIQIVQCATVNSSGILATNVLVQVRVDTLFAED